MLCVLPKMKFNNSITQQMFTSVNMKKSVCHTIDQCFQVLHQIDGYSTSATDDNDKTKQQYDEWRHGVLKQLVPKLSNVKL